MAIRERGRAKVNLTLTVRGRRADGYHELDSLVAFADVGDELVLHPGETGALVVEGPFASAIDGDNLVTTALHLAREAEPRLVVGRIRLVKNLPVAAGLGGGSADAAAALRAVMAANPHLVSGIDWRAIAARLGADVPACLESRPVLMSGIGDRLVPIAPFPPVSVVLANPMVRVPAAKTAAVFRRLTLPAGRAPDDPPRGAPGWPTVSALLDDLRPRSNDLEAAAAALMPECETVQRALAALPGARLVRLSGSGPTAFAIFDGRIEAERAAEQLKMSRPGWWIVAATLS